MKKSTKIVKRIMALFLVVLMSIENFAAVVSDNDGSAFITKAEFDSLKNDFQSQIDQYNASIDAKIDGAIASYLSGIRLGKDMTYNVEIVDWEEVTATNHVLPENWTIPSLNLTFCNTYSSTDTKGYWWETWWGAAGITYDKPTSVHQVRNLVSAGVESTTYTLPETVVWLGQAKDYYDRIVGIKVGVCDSIWGRPSGQATQTHGYSYLASATANSSNMFVCNVLNMITGYIANRSANDVWTASLLWRGLNRDDLTWPLYPLTDSGWINRNMSTSISLNYVDGNQYQYQHIINYGDYNYTCLSDPTWTNSLGPNPSWTEEQVISNSTVNKNGQWGCFEIQDQAQISILHATSRDEATWKESQTRYDALHTLEGMVMYQPSSRSFGAYYSGDYGTTRTTAMKSVGVLDATYKSEKILQWSGKRKLNRDENISYEKINLYNGALIAYAKQDETFNWEPVIKGTYDNGGTDVAITKWRVKLSDKPFGTGESLGTGGKVLKNAGQTNDYIVTDDSGKCKFNFQLGENTTIWCKWWPDDTNICNNYNWKGTLDLTQCGTYTITEAQQ